jgi:cyclopropane fatty-acyl-phospholipid synthase-like methyltransferase
MICRLCHKTNPVELINFGPQPIVHNLLTNIDDSFDLYPFRIGVCEYCGLMQLLECIPQNILYQNYFTLSSWKKQPHIQNLIKLIETSVNSNPKTSILEIGCNDGTFLKSLKEIGFERLLGIEPTTDAYNIAHAAKFEVIKDFFNFELASDIVSLDEKFDLVVARQVLEHIEDLNDFFDGVRLVMRDNGTLLLEIPDSSIHIDYLDFSFWEEHVNYFTLETLTNLLTKHGFSILHSESIVFSGKALIVLAQKNSSPGSQIDRAINKNQLTQVFSMAKNWITFRKNYQKNLKRLKEEGKKIAVFGCGCRSSVLVNFLSISDFLSCYIDDQNEKQNYFVPGNLLPIYPRRKIEALEINHVILGVNAENEKRVITSNHFHEKNISYESILPPSPNIPEFWKKEISE